MNNIIDGIMSNKRESIINKIYESKQEELDAIIKKVTELAKNENGEDFENVRLAKISEEFYKQGFIDGVNLMMECIGQGKHF